MRRLLSFTCGDLALGASFDAAAGPTGVLIATGGSQTRAGSHRMFERLARGLAEAGWPVFRFDRRGVGDSEGEDPGFQSSGADLAAAAAAFRCEAPGIVNLVGLGLCDGATALALAGAEANLAGLVLVNPWLVEASADAPPAAAIKRHYAQRLTSAEGWRRIASGSVDWRKLLKGVSKIARAAPSPLAANVAGALGAFRAPITLILARSDATAIAAAAEWKSARFAAVRERALPPIHVETDSHTFARRGDEAALLKASLEAVRKIESSGRF